MNQWFITNILFNGARNPTRIFRKINFGASYPCWFWMNLSFRHSSVGAPQDTRVILVHTSTEAEFMFPLTLCCNYPCWWQGGMNLQLKIMKLNTESNLDGGFNHVLSFSNFSGIIQMDWNQHPAIMKWSAGFFQFFWREKGNGEQWLIFAPGYPQ